MEKIRKIGHKIAYYCFCVCTLGVACLIRVIITEALIQAKEWEK